MIVDESSTQSTHHGRLPGDPRVRTKGGFPTARRLDPLRGTLLTLRQRKSFGVVPDGLDQSIPAAWIVLAN
ncbi:hypothetical protein HMPREF9621_02375 [Cutibacterium modestum HL037PA2]|nr:hypothetical protein HMPREF9621_02375 [Cutibacterium modestum HL037PA2]REB73165.1 hypothetical protein CP877_10515 [Cutibacterium modestum]